jgi:hypothetical protein
MNGIEELIKGANSVGCIGTRDDLDDARIETCALIGYYLAKLGKTINTGNADGCDSLFALGGNKVDPSLVHLFLPFKSYNPEYIHEKNIIIHESENPEWQPIARAHHYCYDSKLSSRGRQAMNRNVGIILNSQLVIAMPSRKKSWGGGTGHGMKVAKAQNIPLLNISIEETRQALITIILNSGLLPK